MEIQKYKEKTIEVIGSEPRLIPYYFDKVKVKNYENSRVLNIIEDVYFFTANISYFLQNEEYLGKLSKQEQLLLSSERFLNERARYL